MNERLLVTLTVDEASHLIEEIVEKRIRAIMDKTPAKTQPEIMNLEGLREFLRGLGLDMPKSALYKATSTGEIPFQKMGRRLIFRREEILAWVDSHLISPQLDSTSQTALILARSARRTRNHGTRNVPKGKRECQAQIAAVTDKKIINSKNDK